MRRKRKNAIKKKNVIVYIISLILVCFTVIFFVDKMLFKGNLNILSGKELENKDNEKHIKTDIEIDTGSGEEVDKGSQAIGENPTGNKDDKPTTVEKDTKAIEDAKNQGKITEDSKTKNEDTKKDSGKSKNDGTNNIPIKDEGFKLGNERLLTEYSSHIDGKAVGLITNQTGVDSKGVSTISKLSNYKGAKLTALYGPEHGIDGKSKAGAYVQSYTHPTLKIPVYSLYGETRKPTPNMLKNIDVLVFDIQDLGARSYTYISTLNYAMKAAAENNKEIIVLDRPNPLGGIIVDGPVMEDKFITFVGVDNLPMTHGMTVGELAKFFNRKINAKLTVVPMTKYTRNMIFQDTGLRWVQSSPMIPDITSVFSYNATGIGEGTGIVQNDYFKWVGGVGIDSQKFADLLNGAKLPGVTFVAEDKGTKGGVRLNITDYHKFNPAKTGIYMLAYARSLNNFTVPKSEKEIVMFDKIMGTAMIGQALEKNYTPEQIEALYKEGLEKFKVERKKYLIYK